ncbi:MAG TPA: hypothetical protein VFO07_09950 [Roseiflexaceae bacterium]|nr:hypothetical protein [Roseiflexaceae bacterium]
MRLTAAFGSLADGTYLFKIRATDAAGNTGLPALISFAIDATPPTIARRDRRRI